MNAKLEARRFWRGAVRMSETRGRIPILNEVVGAMTLLYLAGIPPFWVFLLAKAPPGAAGGLIGGTVWTVFVALIWMVVFKWVRTYGREEDAPGGKASTSRP